MKLTTNLATRHYVNTRLLNICVSAALVILTVVLILRVREIAYNQAELGRVRGMLAAAASRPGGRKISETQLKSVQSRIAFANTLIDRKAVNWLNLLDRFEEVLPNEVALTQIEPGKDGQSITVNGVARQFSGLRALLENMEQSKNFSDVYLLSQSEARVGLTQRGVTFSISCRVAYR
jgi:type IV pilus assembly protein PilN